MKILVVGDIHVSVNSSIVRRRGEHYSKRLENCINSINWAEEQAEDNNVDLVIYIGDFFDKAELNAEEVTALKEIEWSPVRHVVLVGNHELGNAVGDYSTAHLLNLLPNFEIIAKPLIETSANSHILYLPYIFENGRQTIAGHFKDVQDSLNRIVISHNDLKGVNYGSFVSENGYDMNDIEENCDLFINGHIHNGQKVNDKKKPEIIDIGNLTGQNFSEDASKCEHHIMIVDDKDLSIRYIENPYAFNFYKTRVDSARQIEKLHFKSHAVVSIKCPESLSDRLKEKMEEMKGLNEIEEYKLTTEMEIAEEELEKVESLPTVDYLEQFKNFIIEKIGSDATTLKELQEVLDAN